MGNEWEKEEPKDVIIGGQIVSQNNLPYATKTVFTFTNSLIP